MARSIPCSSTSLIGNPLVRRLADAGLVRYAHRRTAQLDRLNVPDTQWADPAAAAAQGPAHAVRPATRLRPDRRRRAVSARQFRSAPTRTSGRLLAGHLPPRSKERTWPDFIPYYALSSGTTGGTTKYIPISREMLASQPQGGLHDDRPVPPAMPEATAVQRPVLLHGRQHRPAPRVERQPRGRPERHRHHRGVAAGLGPTASRRRNWPASPTGNQGPPAGRGGRPAADHGHQRRPSWMQRPVQPREGR